MQDTQIILGNENNTAEFLLNKMVKQEVPIPYMVAVVSSIVHSCEQNTALDMFDRSILDAVGCKSYDFIKSLEDYHAMKALEVYLDEELPMILENKN